MRTFYSRLFLLLIIFSLTGCSLKYKGSGLKDFHRSSELIGESLTGVYSVIINENMGLRAEKSIENGSITVEDLEPDIIAFENLKLRKEVTNCLVEYSGLLLAIFDRDHTNSVKEYGDALRKSLKNIHSYFPDVITKEVAGTISTIVTMVPERITFLKKRKFAVKLMGEMQGVLDKVFKKLREEIISLKLLAPNLYTRLFREKVEKKWPEKKEKRFKYALMGVKIIKRRERFDELVNDLLRIIEMVPMEHRKLRTHLVGGKGSVITGLSDLLDFSVRVKNSYNLFIKGE